MDHLPSPKTETRRIGSDRRADPPVAGGDHAEPQAIALDRLRDFIGGDRIGRAGRLPAERALADEIGVSRGVLRQALDVLEAEGRITRRQGRGTFLSGAQASPQDLIGNLTTLTNPVDILEVRLAIEPPQARLAALRATRGDIDKLFELAEASRTAGDPESYEKADAAFHRRVAAATRNPLLIAIFDVVLTAASDRSWRLGRETAHCINNQAFYAAAHRRIAEAICERNAALAEDAMRAHLSRVQQQLNEHLFPRSALAE